MLNTLKREYKKVIVVAFLLLCLSLAMTFAFEKNASNTLTNTFTPGSVTTEIKEDDPKPNGTAIEKSPYVTNTGKNDALVRMKVTMTPSQLVQELKIKLNFSDKWAYNEADGYYYYQDILAPGKSTEPLFDKVTGTDIVVDGKFSDKLAGLEIAVYHESVQNLVKDNKDEAIVSTNGHDDAAKQIWEVFDSLNN